MHVTEEHFLGHGVRREPTSGKHDTRKKFVFYPYQYNILDELRGNRAYRNEYMPQSIFKTYTCYPTAKSGFRDWKRPKSDF